MINIQSESYGGVFLYNQTEVILSQYELEIRQMTKGRGFLICETDKGTKLLCPFKGSKDKGEWIREYLNCLKDSGYCVETIFPSQKGDAVVEDDVTGERFWMKDAILGTPLNTAHFGEMIEVGGMLARYHNISERVSDRSSALSYFDVVDASMRHSRELVKVKNYIRTKKRKQEFEQIYMRYFERMHEIAEKSCEILNSQAQRETGCLICHGDCNQHNIVWLDGRWQLIHFENVVYSWSMWDLATYIRKVMEKNGWDEELGLAIVQEYHKVRPIQKEDYQKLCGLILFPEKFWKVANHYMSSNKAWIPEKDIEKLKKVIEQEIHRLKFVENLFSISLE